MFVGQEKHFPSCSRRDIFALCWGLGLDLRVPESWGWKPHRGAIIGALRRAEPEPSPGLVPYLKLLVNSRSTLETVTVTRALCQAGIESRSRPAHRSSSLAGGRAPGSRFPFTI